MNNGFAVIDKPSGMTSHDVVAIARKKLGTRKIGHAGTLDPMATGTLVLGVNAGTKLLQYITAGKKRYLATVKLGVLTSTDDKEGEVIGNSEIPIDIKAAFAKQTGKIMQRPSSVSAIRVDGKRAYDLVREGHEVELPAREVEVYELKILEIRGDEVDIEVACSAGTYIRAIARDCGGHLIALRRTEVGQFKEMVELEDLTPENLIGMADAVRNIFPIRELDLAEVNELKFGRPLNASGKSEIVAGITPDNQLAALLQDRDSRAKPISVFI